MANITPGVVDNREDMDMITPLREIYLYDSEENKHSGNGSKRSTEVSIDPASSAPETW